METPDGLRVRAPVSARQLVPGWQPDPGQRTHGRRPRGRVGAARGAGGRTHKSSRRRVVTRIYPRMARIAYVRHGVRGSELWVCGASGEDATSGGRRRFQWSHSGVGRCGRRTEARWPTAGATCERRSLRLESCDLAGRHPRASTHRLPTDRTSRLHGPRVAARFGRVVFGLTDPPPNQREHEPVVAERRSELGNAFRESATHHPPWRRLALVSRHCSTSGKRRGRSAVLEYQSDVYVGLMDRGAASLLGCADASRFDDRMDMSPTWMPDDSTILFCSDRNGHVRHLPTADGRLHRQTLCDQPRECQSSTTLSPDGARGSLLRV